MKTVWIDAGHGGKDPGAVNKSLNLFEKDLTLKLALETEKQLKKQGINVVMTRTTDTTLNYIPRYKLENNNDCDLAISIHLNSCASPNTARGCEIWIHSKAINEIKNWAASTLNELGKVGDTYKRGVKKGYPGHSDLDFWCNRLTKSMSMLVEIGFINNDIDAIQVSMNYIDYAKALTKSICKQLGVEYKEEKPKPILSVYDFEVYNLNDNNLDFLLKSKMETGETFEEYLQRQVYRYKISKRK